jgi:hypothetical protein
MGEVGGGMAVIVGIDPARIEILVQSDAGG